MATNRDNFTKDTIETIAARVGYKCSYPNCKAETKGPHTDPTKKVSIGEAAHITAASPGGPRYDASLTQEQRKGPENGIWLCRTHARLIDTDESRYAIELLKSWKYQAEYEQYCILNKISAINLNQNRNNEALREINKIINKLNNIYIWFKNYYDMNLSMFSDFTDVDNEIEDKWCIHGESLDTAGDNLHNTRNIFVNVYSEYMLDISEELKGKIDQYIELTTFTYTSVFASGDNYYSRLFQTIVECYDDMSKVIEEINIIIRKGYIK